MTHPFQSYFNKHQHYPRIRLDNGYQRLTVEFAPGYVRITTSPRGQEIWILRSTFLSLLRKSVPLARRWTYSEDHDVPQAMHEAYLHEEVLLQERREQKRARVEDPDQRRRQRQRWLAAKQRSRPHPHDQS